MATTELEKREQKEVVNTSAELLIEASNSFTPDTDIIDTGDNLILMMDLPGVKKGNVDIRIDNNNTLVVRAKNNVNEPENQKSTEFCLGNYYRSFMLSDEFDKEKVHGVLENGCLEITIPRREEVKPRQIKINI